MPFDEDEDVTEEVEKIQSKLLADDEPEEFEVGADVEGEVQENPDDEEPKQSRRERRRARGQNRLNVENDGYRKENADLRERMARLEGAASNYPDPGQLQQMMLGSQRKEADHDPIEDELDDLLDQRKQLTQDFNRANQAGTLTEEGKNAMVGRADQLEEQVSETRFRLNMKRHGSTQPVDNNALFVEMTRRRNIADNSDVYGDERLRGMATGIFNEMLYRSGPSAQGSQEMHDEAMRETRKRAGMKPKGGSQERTTHRTTGYARGSGAGGPTRAAKIQMTPALKVMATSLYPGMSEKDAYQKWANGPGKRLLEEE